MKYEINSEQTTAQTDLKVRTRQFALRIIQVFNKLQDGDVGRVIGHQLLRSGTSIGAQFREGYRSRSKAEYVSKLQSALQELEETMYRLELIMEANLLPVATVKNHLQEANELTAIFTTIVKKVKASLKAERQ